MLFEEDKDAYATGYTENYLRVYLKADNLNGCMKKVKIIKPYLDGALAELI